MVALKTLDKSVVEIFKMPRKKLDFFQVGQLYKLKYNDPYKFKIRYSVIDVKQIDFVETEQAKKTMPNTFSLQLAKTFNIDYVIEMSAQLHNSFVLNDTFICLDSNTSILRNFKSVINGKNVDVCVFRSVPVFLFHDIKNQKPIIGSVQIDMNKQNLDDLFGKEVNEVIISENLVYIENFFEKVTT